MNSKLPLTIKITKLVAEYSSTFHFKIKFGLKTSKDHSETKGTYKYDKGSIGADIDEAFEFPFDITPTPDSLLQFCLQIYTKNGFKTAGAGEIVYSKIKHNTKFDIEFIKCPLGKGLIEVLFTFGSASPLSSTSTPTSIPSSNENKLLDQIVKYKMEIDDLQSKLNHSQSENETLNDQIAKLKKDLSATKTLLASAQSSSSSITNRTNSSYKLDEQLKDKERVIEELKTQNAYFDEENNELKGIVNDLKAEKKQVFDEKNEMIKRLKDENAQLTEKVSNLQYEFESNAQAKLKSSDQTTQFAKQVDAIKSQLQDQIKALQEKTQKLSNDIMQKDNEINELNDKSTALKKTIEQNENEYKQRLIKEKDQAVINEQEIIKKHQSALSEKDIQIIKLTNDLLEKDEMVQAFETKLESITESNINNDNKDIIALTKKINEKESEIRQLKDQMDQIVFEKEKYENQVKCIEIDKDSYLEMSKSTEKKLKDDLIKLRSVIDSKRAEIQKLSDENSALHYENEKAKTDIKTVESNQINNVDFINKIQDMQKSFAERETKLLEEKNQELQLLKKDNESLKLQLKKSSMSDNSKYLMEITRLQEQKSSLEEDLKYYKELNMKFVDTEKKSIVLENDNATLRNMVSERNLAIETLQKENKDMMATKEILEFEIISSKEKLGQVLNELSEMESNQIQLAYKDSNDSSERNDKPSKRKK